MHTGDRSWQVAGARTKLSQLDRIQPVLNANGMDCIKG